MGVKFPASLCFFNLQLLHPDHLFYFFNRLSHVISGECLKKFPPFIPQGVPNQQIPSLQIPNACVCVPLSHGVHQKHYIEVQYFIHADHLSLFNSFSFNFRKLLFIILSPPPKIAYFIFFKGLFFMLRLLTPASHLIPLQYCHDFLSNFHCSLLHLLRSSHPFLLLFRIFCLPVIYFPFLQQLIFMIILTYFSGVPRIFVLLFLFQDLHVIIFQRADFFSFLCIQP